ncbi:kinase-like protein [Gymnopilus junonius]|uniref:non-specific serine/threonine protein kinase n=1 Tax=Gymnopilus junonius TaxID=109634 RepID=A0A9P5NXR8_GYMJU|nr:kinase-like protein [Gymnopilus junonius]
MASETLSPGDLYFDTFGFTEEQTGYSPGGYHPIVIGDILGPSSGGKDSKTYRIINKLGFGSYSTVWLAEKVGEEKGCVAAKVSIAQAQGDVEQHDREATMLESVPRKQFGDDHVLKLLDHFILNGPNGIHSVLVTDVVVPLLQLRDSKRSPLWRKAAARGLVQGVVQLHSAGLVHGDLHLKNIGAAIPELDDQEVDKVVIDLSEHNITVVLPRAAAKQSPSLPAYVISEINLEEYYERITSSEFPRTKILDFGGVHLSGTLPPNFQASKQAVSPEVLFACFVERNDNPHVEPPADIWGVGTAIYEIVTGRALFDHAHMRQLPKRMTEMAGSIPPGWLHWDTNTRGPEPDEVCSEAADKWWASRWGWIRNYCINDSDTDVLILLLRRILVLDAALRPTAEEILGDPWFSQ